MGDEDSEPSGMDTPWWPKPNDVVFQAGQECWENARFDFPPDWRLDFYAGGYREAADIVVERIAQTRQSPNLLIYPIVFLYRHSLELRLKHLIGLCHELLHELHDVQCLHRLDVLWDSYRKILERVYPGWKSATLDAVESSIKRLSQIDPQSMSFRYPTAKNGSATLPAVGPFSVTNLRDVMGRILEFLECTMEDVSARLDEMKYGPR